MATADSLERMARKKASKSKPRATQTSSTDMIGEGMKLAMDEIYNTILGPGVNALTRKGDATQMSPLDWASLATMGFGTGMIGRGAQLGASAISAAAKNATPKLYHGSTYPFQKGEIVRPFRDNNYGASATPDYNFAKKYADQRIILPEEAQRGFSPNVYKVKPIGKAIQHGFHDGKEYSSLGGYIVKGKATKADKAMFTAKQKALKAIKELGRIASRKKKPEPWGPDELL
jgi:hypothetical protein